MGANHEKGWFMIEDDNGPIIAEHNDSIMPYIHAELIADFLRAANPGANYDVVEVELFD